ncbi:hypothetical protein ES703_103939 [subsurface metagenome]
MNASKSILDPWRILLSHLMKLDSYCIPDIIDRTGMVVDWSLTDRENYSHKYRRGAFRLKIIKAYNSLLTDDQLRVSHTIAAELSKMELTDSVNNDLKRIGWNIENNSLVPVGADVKELFFPKDVQHDAYIEIRKIFQEASTSIYVIDPYIDSSIFTILKTIISKPIKVKLLTSKVPPDFVHETVRFLSQYSNFTIKIWKTREFHDRFIILDDSKCWHIGCSIKDAGNKAFMISKFEDNANRDALKMQVDNSLANAQEVNI